MNSQAYLVWCGVAMEYWVLCWVFCSQEYKKVKMVNNMKRNICLILAFTLLFSFSSCQKEVEKSDFTAFAKECLAESYYDICGNFLDENKCKYFYNEDILKKHLTIEAKSIIILTSHFVSIKK